MVLAYTGMASDHNSDLWQIAGAIVLLEKLRANLKKLKSIIHLI